MQTGFRWVAHKAVGPGRLALHAMPGRFESWEDFSAWANQAPIHLIVSLTGLEEIRLKSAAYAAALGNLQIRRVECAIPDFEVPTDLAAFRDTVTAAAEGIRDGKNILVHCGHGIGRTGTFAICLLRELGVAIVDAFDKILLAGSNPETNEQEAFVQGFVPSRGPGPAAP